MLSADEPSKPLRAKRRRQGTPSDLAKVEREVEQLIAEDLRTNRGMPTDALVQPPHGTAWVHKERSADTSCAATKADDSPCNWPAISISGHCFVHDPDDERKDTESERFWSVLQWLQRFSEDRRQAAKFVAIHVSLELSQRFRKRRAASSEDAQARDPDAVAQQLATRWSQLDELVTNEIADTLLTDQEALDRAEREQATIWALRDSPEGREHPFNRAMRDGQTEP